MNGGYGKEDEDIPEYFFFGNRSINVIINYD